MTESTPLTPQDFLEQLLGQGRDLIKDGQASVPELTDQARALGRQGEDLLIDKLGLDDTPEARANIRQQARYAGMAGGLALLLKSRSMRKMAALGGLAALGTIAYRGHQRGAMPTDFKDAVGLLTGKAAEARTDVLLRAMIAAARADGAISDTERALLERYPDMTLSALEGVLDTPADPIAVAAMAKSAQEGAEIYAVSARVCDGLNTAERDYLDRLAMALRLDPEAAALIETEVRTG